MKCSRPIQITLRGAALRNYVQYNHIPNYLSREWYRMDREISAGKFIPDKWRMPVQSVPCGHCLNCRRSRQNTWVFRCLIEFKTYPNAFFITLTYDDDHIHEDFSLHKEDVQKMLKRLRFDAQTSDFVSYFYCGEYGKLTQRPHYHMLLYFHDCQRGTYYTPWQVFKLLRHYWPYGNIYIGSVSPASIMYCTKYILKDHPDPYGALPSYSDASKRPAIGSSFLDTDMARYMKDTLTTCTGLPFGFYGSLPRYYRDKLFSEQDKFQLYCSHADDQLDEDPLKLARDYKQMDDLEQIYNFKHQLLQKSIL